MRIILVLLVVSVVLTGCSDNYEDYVNESLNQEEFVRQVFQDNQELRDERDEYYRQIQETEARLSKKDATIKQLLNELRAAKESLVALPSPQGNIEHRDVFISRDDVLLNIGNTFAAAFQDTKSMEPVLNSHSLAIQVKPNGIEVRPGDIISFRSNYTESLVVHRVIAVGKDREGWFAITRGDNNPRADPGQRRLEDIIGVTVAIIY